MSKTFSAWSRIQNIPQYVELQRAALLSIIGASSKGASYESDIYEAYESAQDENIKLAMLRILGATGDDLAEDAINDALNSGNPSLSKCGSYCTWQIGQ